MIVLDASAVAEMLSASNRGAAISSEVLDSDAALHAPDLLDAEVANALRKAWLRNELQADRGQLALETLPALPILRHSVAPLLPRVWALRQVMTAYDACYVSLAEVLGAPLVTCDARLARAHGHVARIELR